MENVCFPECMDAGTQKQKFDSLLFGYFLWKVRPSCEDNELQLPGRNSNELRALEPSWKTGLFRSTLQKMTAYLDAVN